MTPYFTEKMRKYFFGCRCFILLAKKVPSLIPTENSQMHPLNLKKFLSLHLFGIGKSKRTLFLRKNFEKYFLFGCGTAYFTYLKSPFTYLEFECKNATCLSEKTEKIFLKRSFVLKTYPHLFPLGEGVWGQ